MNPLRWWIGLLSLVSFTAGLAGGMMLTLKMSKPPAAGSLAEFEALFVERFQLSSERARCLRVLLESYEKEVAQLYSQRLLQSGTSPGAEIAMKSQEYNQWIREKVLPSSQRAEYSQLSLPAPFTAH